MHDQGQNQDSKLGGGGGTKHKPKKEKVLKILFCQK